MRIAQVTATFPPYYAGTGLVCYHNALGLVRRGHQVTVFTAGASQPASPADAELDVRRLPALFQLGNAPFLPGLLKLRDYDLIHLHYPFIFGAELTWMVSKLRHIPYLLTYHNDLLSAGSRRWLFNPYFALAAPLVFRAARRLGVVSLDYAAACKATPLFRKRWSDVVEIPNGVDADVFRPGLDGSPVRQKLGISASARIIAFVGALDRAHPFKRVDYLLRTFSRLDDPSAVLLIIGDGDLKASFIQLAEQLDLAQRAVFAGAVPHDQLPPFYAAADIVVLPSSPPESFGLVLIEALACGVPVVAQRIPGVRSVVTHGQDGLLVQPGDSDGLAKAMLRLLDDPPLRQEMGRVGWAKVTSKYAWPRVIDQLEQIYASIL
jgi:glycosyltransferase involved in cell wall biosynthesis